MTKCKSRPKYAVLVAVMSAIVYVACKYEFDREYLGITSDQTGSSTPDPYPQLSQEVTVSLADRTPGAPTLAPHVPENATRRYNVLFVMADDLRPQLGAYLGQDYPAPSDPRAMYTPNMDRLARKSLVLTRAYAQYSLCGPSRASMLTSRRPDTTKVYQNTVHWRQSGPDITSLPQYFKNNGYHVIGAGKIFHVDNSDDKDDRVSWSEPYFHAAKVQHVTTAGVNWLAVPDSERQSAPLEDEQIVDHVVTSLRRLAPAARSGSKPFFAAVGFYRPHVPHICPDEFYKHYPLESGRYMSHTTWQSPSIGPYCTMAPFRQGLDNRNLTRIPRDVMKQLRRAYFACVSYIDQQIGHLLDALDELGLAESTVVSLVADHGYHLGENDWYSKYTSYDIALHVPLMLHIPGRTDHGIQSRSLVELLDVFPTVSEAAGLGAIDRCPAASSRVSVCTDGVSLLPLIARPSSRLRAATFSQVARGRDMTEYTVRTHRYRLVDFAVINRTQPEANVSDHRILWSFSRNDLPFKRRFHDHKVDPEESVNLYPDPEYKQERYRLQQVLRQQFTNIYQYPRTIYEGYT